MNHHQQGIFARGVIIRRFDEYAFNGRPVRGVPPDHFPRSQAEILPLLAQIGQVFGSEVLHRRYENLAEPVRPRDDSRHGPVIARECRARYEKLVRPAHPLHRQCCRVQPEYVRTRFLQRAKVDAIRPPVFQPRILVEGGRQYAHLPAIRRYHRDAGIRIEVELLSVRRREGDLPPIRRPHRTVMRAIGFHQFLQKLVRDIHHIDLGGAGGTEVRIARGAESDALGIGRPREIAHAEFVACGERLGFRPLFGIGGNLGGRLDQPQVQHGVVAIHDLEVAVLFFAVLLFLRVRPRGGVSDGARVRRPFERVHSVILAGQLRGFPAGRRD